MVTGNTFNYARRIVSRCSISCHVVANISNVTAVVASVIRRCTSMSRTLVRLTVSFTKSHKKKSNSVMSGER